MHTKGRNGTGGDGNGGSNNAWQKGVRHILDRLKLENKCGKRKYITTAIEVTQQA